MSKEGAKQPVGFVRLMVSATQVNGTRIERRQVANHIGIVARSRGCRPRALEGDGEGEGEGNDDENLGKQRSGSDGGQEQA